MPPLLRLFGEPIFLDTAGWALAFLLIGYAGAFSVKGVFGIGAAPIIVPLGACVLEAHHAILLAMLVVTYIHVLFIPESFRKGEWRVCGLLAIGYAPAVVLGVLIFDQLSNARLGVVVGFLLMVIILAEIFVPPQPVQNIAKRLPRSGAIGVAFLSGLISGIVGAGSMIFLSLYLKALYDDARTFRATILLIAITVSFWRFTVQYSKGLITVSLIGESLVLAPAAFLGTFLGMRLFHFMPSARYFKAFQVFLLLAALSVILRGLAAVN